MEDLKKQLVRQYTVDAIGKLLEKHGETHRERIETGAGQTAACWHFFDEIKDGTPEEFIEFCEQYFVADPKILEQLFLRLQSQFEQINGLFYELKIRLDLPQNVDIGPKLPIDSLFAAYNPAAHLSEDMFQSKLAFIVLLNFKQEKLEACLKDGADWPQRKWAEARLADEVSARVPAEIEQAIAKALAEAEDYINSLNFYAHNLRVPMAETLPPDAKWQSHWELRDHLREFYQNPSGLEFQKVLYGIMRRVIEQSVPRVVINNPDVCWDPRTNQVADKNGRTLDNSPEPHTRYEKLLQVFRAEKDADHYYDYDFISRSFNDDREILEARFRKMMEELLSSPVARKIGALILKRLRRPLQPFDIWYDQFSVGQPDVEALDAVVKSKYPDVSALQNGLPDILLKLGFSKERADFLASWILVEPGRGCPHCTGVVHREGKNRFRVRFGEGGLSYDQFNGAMHELFHAIEGIFSTHCVSHALLRGVPGNNAITEAFAFVGQDRNLFVLDMEKPSAAAWREKTLGTFWKAFEMAGVGLADMDMWNWMYEHPESTAAELCQAVQDIAKNIWNKYFAPVFGSKDEPLLAIYSHFIDCGLYTPDYFLGFSVAFQIEDYFRTHNLAQEMERMCSIGNIVPDLWMERATGNPISPRPLIRAAEEAIKR